MVPVYFILIISLLAIPLVVSIISRHIKIGKILPFIKLTYLFLLIYFVLNLFNYSFSGDYPDYIMYSLAYFMFCLAVFNISNLSKSIFSILFRVFGWVVISVFLIIGFVGIVLFIPAAHEFHSDKQFRFKSNNNSYESRRYNFGFATLNDIKYTFTTYKKFEFLPFEKEIDCTSFLDTKTEVDIASDDLKIEILGLDSIIIFKSANGQMFKKRLK